MTWQQANVQAAAAYLRERIAAGATDSRTLSVYEGLLEVLDPGRRTVRLRRELAESTRSVPIPSGRERRARTERRSMTDRRQARAAPPDGAERRSGVERRSGRDRRPR